MYPDAGRRDKVKKTRVGDDGEQDVQDARGCISHLTWKHQV